MLVDPRLEKAERQRVATFLALHMERQRPKEYKITASSTRCLMALPKTGTLQDILCSIHHATLTLHRSGQPWKEA